MNSRPVRLAAAALLATFALLLGACHHQPEKPAPRVALWAIEEQGHAKGWIMGTIHALPPDTTWRRPAIDSAMTGADRLVMEIGEPIDPNVAGQALARLAMTPGLPPPSARLDNAARSALGNVYRKLGVDDSRFLNEESWAVALQISALASQKAGAAADNGVEPQLRKAMAGKPVVGLETVDSQFAIFDALPTKAQNVLLTDVVREAAADRDDDADMLDLWLRGDDLGMAREANSGFLSDPVLHEALLAARNRAWTERIDALLKDGAHPFIAVGAAHVAGHDGLPEMLKAKGWTIRRVY